MSMVIFAHFDYMGVLLSGFHEDLNMIGTSNRRWADACKSFFYF